jgi:DNA-binding NtrC family response regulator
MGQAEPKRPTALIVEDDAELRSLTAALLEEEQLDTIECESAEAALAVLLIGGQEIAMIFADVRLPGAMDGIDLAWEVKLRWPLLPVVLTSGHPRERERVCELPPGVAFLPKPWQPFNILVVAEEALASAQQELKASVLTAAASLEAVRAALREPRRTLTELGDPVRRTNSDRSRRSWSP